MNVHATASRFVLRFDEIDRAQVALVGGKGAHLGALSRIEGVRVPPGFCVTTDAFRAALDRAPSLGDALDRLTGLKHTERDAIREQSAEIRRSIEALPIPADVHDAITQQLAHLGEEVPYAVRSSATAEDSPTASFAGQHDTFLNVVGRDEILKSVKRCWASLFSERAVTYRARNGFDHRKLHMAVVVQQMVFSQAAGILFTADPVTGHRKVTSIDASFGLGEALVSGLVNADVYKVRDDVIVDKSIAAKKVAVHAASAGGTQTDALDVGMQKQPALTDAHVLELARIGRKIEAHFGRPQDIEWCLVDDAFHIVQSRPITTLFPIPAANDGANHVYVSVGHQQMMTDAMKPLGVSMWKMIAMAPMVDAGGRIFIDVTRALSIPASRAMTVRNLRTSDPLTGDALETVLKRNFIELGADAPRPAGPPAGAPPPLENDPALVEQLIERTTSSLAKLKTEIEGKSGVALFDFILADVQELQKLMRDPQSHQAIWAAVETTLWLHDQMNAWLGEKNAADALTQSAPNNITSEMGLALLDVADVIRPHADVVARLERVKADDDFIDDLATLDGGAEARDAIRAFLVKYGMRCPGEIDITRPRFSEKPASLVPMILANIKSFHAGESARRFEQGRENAAKKERELLERLRSLPDGEEKAQQTKKMIERLRTFIGYREFPKYGIVSRLFVYKLALLKEAEGLVAQHVLREKEDAFFLTFQELHDVVRTQHVDDALIRERKDAFKTYQTLTPPRVLTSDGEMVGGQYRRDDFPAGALVGLAVSAGVVEGRARVVLDVADAHFEPGDILVTAFTDPSWTPAFVAVKGLVTEVGGLMTHGAVIAREYGLPAVVGVENATRLIRDGQRVRVHGTEGWVELLPHPNQP